MDREDWWALSDSELLRQCHVDCYRASGPGGQKRNKTDSAVRIRHASTGVQVVAAESRSQHENRARALRRIRASLAFELRQPVEDGIVPDFVRLACSDGKFSPGKRDPLYLPVAAYVLDLLNHHEGRVADAAKDLDVSTAALTTFLQSTPECWRAAQQVRSAHHLRPLR